MPAPSQDCGGQAPVGLLPLARPLPVRPLALGFGLLALFLALPALDAPFFFDDEGDLVLAAAHHHVWPPDWLYVSRRPLTGLTFALSWWLGGGAPLAFRMPNVAIHVAAALLVRSIGRRLLASPRLGWSGTSADRGAWAAALLWLVHPLHTSAVTYAVHRYESLAALLTLAGLEAFLRHVSTPRGPWAAAAVLALLLGGLSKETVFMAPALFLLIDATLLAPGFAAALRERGRLHLCLALAVAPIALLVLFGPSTPSQEFGRTDVTPLAYLRSQPSAIATYLRLTVWPDTLCVDYSDWPVLASLRQWRAGSVGVAALAVLAAVGTLRGWVVTLPLAAMFLWLAPTSSIVPLSSELVAERRMYLPLAGLALGLVAALGRVLPRPPFPGWFGAALALAAAACLAGRTWVRNLDFRTPVALYAAESASRPRNSRDRFWYAVYLEAAGQREAAWQQIQLAMRMAPWVKALPSYGARMALGSGHPAEAARLALHFLKGEPDSAEMASVAAEAMLATVGGREAVRFLEERVAQHPDEGPSLEWLAWLLATDDELRDGRRAVEVAQRAVAASREGRVPLSVFETSAAALAASGDTEGAKVRIDRLLEAQQVGTLPQADLARLRAERDAYAAGRPWSRTSGASAR
jgi:hypothetical protein